jgi:hypothetical protein
VLPAYAAVERRRHFHDFRSCPAEGNSLAPFVRAGIYVQYYQRIYVITEKVLTILNESGKMKLIFVE